MLANIQGQGLRVGTLSVGSLMGQHAGLECGLASVEATAEDLDATHSSTDCKLSKSHVDAQPACSAEASACLHTSVAVMMVAWRFSEQRSLPACRLGCQDPLSIVHEASPVLLPRGLHWKLLCSCRPPQVSGP